MAACGKLRLNCGALIFPGRFGSFLALLAQPRDQTDFSLALVGDDPSASSLQPTLHFVCACAGASFAAGASEPAGGRGNDRRNLGPFSTKNESKSVLTLNMFPSS